MDIEKLLAKNGSYSPIYIQLQKPLNGLRAEETDTWTFPERKNKLELFDDVQIIEWYNLAWAGICLAKDLRKGYPLTIHLK